MVEGGVGVFRGTGGGGGVLAVGVLALLIGEDR